MTLTFLDVSQNVENVPIVGTSTELPFDVTNSTINTPLVIINEHPSLVTTPSVFPHNHTVLENDDSVSSVTELCVDNPPVGPYTIFPDPRRLHYLLSQYIPPKRNTMGNVIEYKTIKKYTQEAIRRYEAYRQEWKKFYTPPNI
uniref:Cauli_VI domain-containing protein n=1 Tax=Syphacia muris TaxID=451379 RepID=A0A0N5ADN1_9BILA